MWNIAHIPMIISKWSPIEEEGQDEEVRIMPMWITMKNVPHKMFSWQDLSFLESATGKPVRVHPETELCSNFEEAKLFVEANLMKELPKKYHFKYVKLGVDAEVEFEYPWLPSRCSLCSKMGSFSERLQRESRRKTS